MTAPIRPSAEAVACAKAWLETHGAALSSMSTAEALASYAAPLEAELQEEETRESRLIRDLEDMTAERNAYVSEIEGEREGRSALRREFGIREDETVPAFVRRLAKRSDLLGAIEYDKGRGKPGSDEARFVVMCIHDKPHYAVPEIQSILDARDAAVSEGARRSEDRIVERVLDGVAEMICTAMEKSGQGQAAKAIRKQGRPSSQAAGW